MRLAYRQPTLLPDGLYIDPGVLEDAVAGVSVDGRGVGGLAEIHCIVTALDESGTTQEHYPPYVQSEEDHRRWDLSVALCADHLGDQASASELCTLARHIYHSPDQYLTSRVWTPPSPSVYAQVMKRSRIDQQLVWQLMRFADEPVRRPAGHRAGPTSGPTGGSSAMPAAAGRTR